MVLIISTFYSSLALHLRVSDKLNPSWKGEGNCLDNPDSPTETVMALPDTIPTATQTQPHTSKNQMLHIITKLAVL